MSIVRYVSGNKLPSNLSTQYTPAKVSLVIYLSVVSELINRRLLKAHTVLLSGILCVY